MKFTFVELFTQLEMAVIDEIHYQNRVDFFLTKPTAFLMTDDHDEYIISILHNNLQDHYTAGFTLRVV